MRVASSGITRPSRRRCSPLTDTVRRRSSRTGVESRRCATLSAKHAATAATPAGVSASALDQNAVAAGNAPHAGREPEVRVEAPAEPLEVVGEHEEDARDHERDQASHETVDRAVHADRARPGQARDGEHDQRAIARAASAAAVRAARRARARRRRPRGRTRPAPRRGDRRAASGAIAAPIAT